ncbi:MAG: DHA1 family tetracycline resistance protein-like MFS transporter [Brevundimonas sp.]|jgi:DHA1 family tetracycline resistance protein-like MFS transporter|uniref:MFS transporter n=1 Tax=Brevundimonas sp. TaxID=1871086 RepID=UPI0039E6AD41
MRKFLLRERSSSSALPFILASAAFSAMSLSITFPVLPQIIEGMASDPRHAGWINGALIALWSALHFLAAPVLGALSDRYGRKTVIVLSNAGFAADYLLIAFAPDLFWLVLGRVFSGLLSGNVAASHAYVADITAPGDRASAFGALRAAIAVGFICGPVVGGLLGALGERLPFFVSAAAAGFVALYGAVLLPESLPQRDRAPFRWQSANAFGSIKWLLTIRQLNNLTLIAFLAQFAHHALQATFVLYATNRFGLSKTAIGVAFGVMGVCAILANTLVLRAVLKRLSEKGALVFSLAAGAAGFLMYGTAPNSLVFWLAIPVMALWGMSGPVAQALMTREVGPREQGRLQGGVSSVAALSGIVGPMLFGIIYYAVSDYPLIAGGPFLIASVILGAAAFISSRNVRDAR